MKSLLCLGSALILLSAASGACFEDPVPVGSDDAGAPASDGGGGSGSTCSTDSDCPSGEGCAYEESEACSAKGKCVTEAQVVCEAYSAGCACDGTTINVGCTPYPAGYSSKPLAHTGACSDSGVVTPPTTCTSDSDCPTGDGCAYLESEACSAKGTCVSEAQAMCEAFSPGCACDGTTINVACTPYPAGYVSKPLAHTGECGDGGGGVLPPTTCTSDSDCQTGDGCAYLESEACSATGTCVPETAATCQAYSPGCACDGTVINTVCTPYPTGYVSKPLAHVGDCADAG